MKKDDKINFGLKVIMALLFLTGAAVFSYPFVVDSLNNFIDQQMIAKYQQEANERNAAQRDQLIEEMAQKNAEMSHSTNIPGMGLVEDPFEDAVADAGNPGREYYEEHTLGAIYIPAINVSLPLFDETNDLLLQRGATLLQGTSYPIGGEDSHSVITGHTGLPDKKLFTDLEKLKKGDMFYIDVLGEKLAYKVDSFKTVLPTEIDSLVIQPGRDLVTLLTCTPYMVNTHRLLVTGYRVPYEEEMAQAIQKAQNYHKYRLILMIIGIIAFLALFCYWIWRKIVAFLATKHRYDLRFTIAPQAEVAFELLDKKGQPILLENEPQQASADENGEVLFAAIPGGFYKVRAVAGDWQLVKAKVWRIKDKEFKLRGKTIKRLKKPTRYVLRRGGAK
ncbi:hypothetical protein RU97_GL002559 [Enterococcus canis]|uniref:Sortase n=1 Tax=Enterococcus canis TaxID=214095 RepID=A0A1L8RCR3_9ENTE|nr:class C sortase [Enterococcus canis]OJG17551.1 hypothetical protein RU97_GL002559 [Enterococcus canis]